MDVSYGLDGNRKCKGSSGIRTGFDLLKHIQRDSSLIQYLICLETSSNPVRNVRMQWSNTKQTGIPYAPVWVCNLLLTELVNVIHICTSIQA